MDKIIESLDPVGSFQKTSAFLLGCISSFTAATIYSSIFTTAFPKFSCRTLESTLVYNDQACSIWSNSSNSSLQDTCDFDKTFYGTTIINQWNLICDRKYMANLTQSFYMMGSLLGIFAGYFGDRFGRKRVIMIALVAAFLTLFTSQLLLVNQFNISFKTQYVSYLIAQFLLGLIAVTLYGISYVLLIELTINKYHVLFSNIILYAYISGEIIVLVAAYFSRDWKIINWVLTGFVFIIIIPCGRYLKESPRLLARKCQYDETIQLLKQISKINNSTVNSDQDLMHKQLLIDENNNKINTASKKNFFQDIFTNAQHLIQTLLLSYLWISLNFLYYGVTLGITEYNESINPYLTYLMSSIAEVLGYSLCFLNNKYGRKRPNIVYLLSTGIVCLIVSSIPYVKSYLFGHEIVVIVVFTLIGKCMTAAAWNTCYVYSSELYTSNVRSSAMLFLCCIGRVGSLIAPQVNLLSSILWKQLPYMIFSISALLSSLTVFILPEKDLH